MMKFTIIILLICFEFNVSASFSASTNNLNEMHIEETTDSLFLYHNCGRYFIIRNKRIVEVSEVIKLDNNYIYLQKVSDSIPVLYKKIMLLADVFCKSFPDRETAETYINEIKKNNENKDENWIKDCLLNYKDSIDKEK